MAFKSNRAKHSDLVLGDEATDGINFNTQAKSISLTPERDSGIDRALHPDAAYPYADEPTWTLSIGFIEGNDPADRTSVLGAYLFAHDGEIVPFTYRPDANDPSVGWKGNVMIITGGFGSTQGSTSEQEAALPVQGQPEGLDGSTLGSGLVGAPAAWTATTAVVYGAQLTTGGKTFKVTTAGTTGASAPTVTSTIIGQSVIDGTAVLTRIA